MQRLRITGSFVHRGHTGEAIGLEDKQVHERKWEIYGRFLCPERWLLAITVRFMVDSCVGSI